MPAEMGFTPLAEAAAAQATPVTTERKKQILVVVLAAGLLMAILTQPDKQVAVAEPVVEANWARPTQPPRQNIARQAGPSESAKLRAHSLTEVCERSRIPWDEIAKSELLAPEPLPVRQTLVSPTPPVQAIYGTSTTRAALIGESIVRGGQTLPTGGKVMEVTTSGIEVAR